MKTPARVVLAAALLLALLNFHPTPAHSAIDDAAPQAQTPLKLLRRAVAPPTFLYTLSLDSQYVQGCFPAPPFPCAGPLVLFPEFGGSFGLTFTGVDAEGFSSFAMSNVTLTALGGSNVIQIDGVGTYRVNQAEGIQEMTLDVLVNGQPTVFDSGLVDLGDGTDEIDISVDMNDLVNYDILMTIVANPGA